MPSLAQAFIVLAALGFAVVVATLVVAVIRLAAAAMRLISASRV